MKRDDDERRRRRHMAKRAVRESAAAKLRAHLVAAEERLRQERTRGRRVPPHRSGP